MERHGKSTPPGDVPVPFDAELVGAETELSIPPFVCGLLSGCDVVIRPVNGSRWRTMVGG